MATRNHNYQAKENDKNRLNKRKDSINPEEETSKKRPKSAKYDDLESAKSMFYSTF
jgi:hypothetical protein